MKLKDLKYIIFEELRALKKQKLIKESKQILNEVEITCCKASSFNAECCGAKRKACCDLDAEYGRGSSGCCEGVRGPAGDTRFVRREM